MLDAEDGQGQAWLHDRGEVLSRRNYQDGRVLMKVRLTTDKAGQAQARFGTAMKLLGQKKVAAQEASRISLVMAGSPLPRSMSRPGAEPRPRNSL